MPKGDKPELMKYIVNLLILALIVFLCFALYSSIKEPIAFRTELTKRKNKVTDKLQNLRRAQEMHREITGGYAPTFDSLSYVLTNDSIPFAMLEADPDDPTNPDKFITTMIYFSAKDSIESMGIDLANLQYVPYSDNKVSFEMAADTITYQSTLVPVMQAMTKYDAFMGPFADPRFRKYEKDFDPKARIGFGSMASPNLEGNWN